MTWNKTWLSWLLWTVGSAGICICFGYAVYVAAPEWGAGTGIGQILAVCLAFALAAGIAAAVWGVAGKIRLPRMTPYTVSVLECFVAIGIVAAGLIIRIEGIDGGTQEAFYYDTAKVVRDGTIQPLAHGAQHLYVLLLHLLFSLVGNQWTAGLILQIVLQAVAACVLYLGIRKLAGAIPALFMIAGLMLLPGGAAESLTYSPKMLYLLCYAIGVLWIAFFLERRKDGRITKWYHLTDLLFLGIYLAFLLYMDIAGITLWVIVLSALWQKAEDKLPAAELAVILFGFLTGLAGIFYIDAVNSGVSFFSVLNVWVVLYTPEKIAIFAEIKSAIGQIIQENGIVFAAGLFCMLTGIPGMFAKDRGENCSIWSMLFGVLTFVWGMGMQAPVMSHTFLFDILFFTAAGVSVAQIRCRTAEHQEAEETKNTIVHEEREAMNEIPESTDKTEEISREKEKPPVKFLENPLPLPKKHVKKTMGYKIDLDDNSLGYDIDIAENDDFDI